MDRITATDFQVVGKDTFRFRAPAAPQYPLDTAGGEASRMTMLEGWLSDNGLCAGGYEILSRQPIKRSVFTYDVTYEGRCKA
jgi:hypothetical protein